MKNIVVIGAFDRYNYGDNLMPILFEFFLKKYYPNIFNKYNLEFSALVDSDLSKYKAKKTVAISKVFDGRHDSIHAVIAIGGEVLCASSSALFLHMNHSAKLVKFIKLLRKMRLSILADMVCQKYYGLPWEYPYIPKRLEPHIKVAFNTVGGGVPKRVLGPYLHSVRKRLFDADYLSVRDKRTARSLEKFCSPTVFPDSAIVMSYLVSDEFLGIESRVCINKLKSDNYICFQAAPKKVGASAYQCAETLGEISKKHGLKVILCPIGYASGHDDIEFLREVEKHSNGEFIVLDDLNLWEIMSVIRHSKFFIGTSLHGVITALSFSVPHIGVNQKVVKLDKFLAEWGIGSSNKCYSILEILDIFDSVLNFDKEKFRAHSKYLIELGLTNYHDMVNSLHIEGKELTV